MHEKHFVALRINITPKILGIFKMKDCAIRHIFDDIIQNYGDMNDEDIKFYINSLLYNNSICHNTKNISVTYYVLESDIIESDILEPEIEHVEKFSDNIEMEYVDIVQDSFKQLITGIDTRLETKVDIINTYFK